MKPLKPFIFLLSLVVLFSCKTELVKDDNSLSSSKESFLTQYLQVNTQENDELNYENLRLYFIKGTDKFFEENKQITGLKTLAEAMELPRFFITEKKPYGRFEDAGAVNSLTIQNKTQDTIFLQAGDVVQGGNQDRLLAEDLIVLPNSIRDISVFCVEKGRWNYRKDSGKEDEAAKKKRKMFAFTGYYNIASSDLRKTAIQTNNQNKVWAKVGELTAVNNADSQTQTYTNLENSESFTRVRNEYIAFYEGKIDEMDDTIGVIAVSGTKVIAVDVFNNSALFKKQFKPLLHSYVIDAISKGDKVVMSSTTMNKYAEKLDTSFSKSWNGKIKNKQMFRYKESMIHFTEL